MKATDALGELRRLDRPVIESREAAARLRLSASSTTHLLRSMEAAGLAMHLRRGLWLLDLDADPVSLTAYLTAPYPSYVSLYSALSHHGLIEQIPRQIYVVSLDRSRRISNPKGAYSIHHVAPEVFGGFTGDPRSGYMATAEKALFDTVYIRSARKQRTYLPELELPGDFDRSELDTWTDKINPGWLRTIVRRELTDILTKGE